MEQPKKSTRLKRVSKVCLILVLLAAVTVILFGVTFEKINNENKKLEVFIENTGDIQADFEKSLSLYTEETEKVVDFLLGLRPESDKQYIRFISEVESIALELSLRVELKSVQKLNTKKNEETEDNSLEYLIEFFGNRDDMKSFLHRLEELNYFIKIEEITYDEPKFLDSEKLDENNIVIKIKLYIK